jgi:predicted O-methyltransferase YrrM
VRLRSVFVGAGLIPPRTMHSEEDAAVLRATATGRRRVVELGVYEGSSAVVLCEVLDAAAELHLVDPFGHHGWALPAGWGATEGASRRVVARAARRHAGPRVHWHVDYSGAVAQRWEGAVDLVFIDGDHSEEGVRTDWEDWHGFVEPGGAVLFHDARLSQPGGRGCRGRRRSSTRCSAGRRRLAGWRSRARPDRTVAVVRRDVGATARVLQQLQPQLAARREARHRVPQVVERDPRRSPRWSPRAAPRPISAPVEGRATITRRSSSTTMRAGAGGASGRRTSRRRCRRSGRRRRGR